MFSALAFLGNLWIEHGTGVTQVSTPDDPATVFSWQCGADRLIGGPQSMSPSPELPSGGGKRGKDWFGDNRVEANWRIDRSL